MDQMELALLGIRNRNCCNHQPLGEWGIEVRRMELLQGECIVAAQSVENRMALRTKVVMALGKMAR